MGTAYQCWSMALFGAEGRCTQIVPVDPLSVLVSGWIAGLCSRLLAVFRLKAPLCVLQEMLALLNLVLV